MHIRHEVDEPAEKEAHPLSKFIPETMAPRPRMSEVPMYDHHVEDDEPKPKRKRKRKKEKPAEVPIATVAKPSADDPLAQLAQQADGDRPEREKPSGAQQMASQLARKRQANHLVLFSCIFAAVVAIPTIITLIVMSGNDPVTPPDEDDGGTVVVPDPIPLPPDNGHTPPKKDIVVAPDELIESGWQRIDDRYAMVQPPLEIINEKLLPPANGETDMMYTGAVINKSPHMISGGKLFLNLVNADNRVYARREYPVGLLPSQGKFPFRIPVTPAHIEHLVLTQWIVHGQTGSKKSIEIENVNTELRKKGSTEELFIKGRGNGRKLKDASFVITALDGNGHVVGRWRAQYKYAIGADKDFEFMVSLPINLMSAVENWNVVGEGRPMGRPG